MVTRSKDRSVQMDMLHGPMLKNILLFALPLALGGILQQLFTSADMAVVFWFSRGDGSVEQSAVNSNGALVNLLINLFSGLSVGATVSIAELIGRKKTDDIHSVVLTSIVLAVAGGVVLLVAGILLAEPLLTVMDTPPEALELAVTYLRIYFAGMPFLMVYNFGSAILRSIGDTAKSLIILLITGVVNVGLNMLFVGACGMGVAGVAIATVICNAISAALVVFFVMRNKLLRMNKSSRVRLDYIKSIAKIGLPAGLQGVVFSLSNVLIQTSINGFGTSAMAGSGDAVNFECYAYFFVAAFAQTTVTFFGQNYAAGKFDRCRQIFKLNMICALIFSTVLGAVFTFGGRLFIRIYTSDEQAIKFALIRMWCVLLPDMLTCLYEIGGGALRGMGHSMLPAVFTVIGSCLLRIVWVYTVFAAYKEFWVLMIVYPVSWLITGAAMIIAYIVIAKKAFAVPVSSEGEPSEQNAVLAAEYAGDTNVEAAAVAENVVSEPSGEI